MKQDEMSINKQVVAKRRAPASPDVQRSAAASIGHEFTAIGRLLGFDSAGRPLVQMQEALNAAAAVARTCVSLAPGDAGREVCVALASDELIILGVLRDHPQIAEVAAPTPGTALQVELDGQVIVLTARQTLALKCGEASITLTRAGKVIISGNYVVSRSRGVNAVKGGIVEIN